MLLTRIASGATIIDNSDVAKNWLADNVTQGGVPMTGGVGAYNDYAAIHAYWVDTTNMDNLGKFDGSLEDVTRGGSTIHTNTDTAYDE